MKAMQDALKNKEALNAAEANVAKATTDEAKYAALMEVKRGREAAGISFRICHCTSSRVKRLRWSGLPAVGRRRSAI